MALIRRDRRGLLGAGGYGTEVQEPQAHVGVLVDGSRQTFTPTSTNPKPMTTLRCRRRQIASAQIFRSATGREPHALATIMNRYEACQPVMSPGGTDTARVLQPPATADGLSLGDIITAFMPNLAVRKATVGGQADLPVPMLGTGRWSTGDGGVFGVSQGRPFGART